MRNCKLSLRKFEKLTQIESINLWECYISSTFLLSRLFKKIDRLKVLEVDFFKIINELIQSVASSSFTLNINVNKKAIFIRVLKCL